MTANVRSTYEEIAQKKDDIESELATREKKKTKVENQENGVRIGAESYDATFS